MRYAIVARTAEGQLRCYKTTGGDPADAVRQARVEPASVLSVQPLHHRLDWRRSLAGGPKLDDLIFARQLHTLLEAGLSVQDALRTLASNQPESVQGRICAQLLASVQRGLSLSRALEREEGRFPLLLTSMIATGEGTGNLPIVLERYAAFVDQRRRIKQKVRAAMIYPAVVVLARIAVNMDEGGLREMQAV